MEGKNIKVYGTLINKTLNTDTSMRDSQHNDLIAVAYQLFDERFDPKKGSGTNGAVINIDRYQDIINKRLTAISYDPDDDITNIYSNLYVDGDTNIGGDLTVEGDTIFKGDVNITGDISIDMGLDDLNDVTLSTMAVGQVLRYNGSKWVNAKLSIDDLEMPAATAGLVLKFNGTKWVADTDNAGQYGATTLDELSDVDTTGKQNGDTLIYDSASGEWKPGNVSGSYYDVLEVNALVTSHNMPYYTMDFDTATRVVSAFYIGDNQEIATIRTARYLTHHNDDVPDYSWIPESNGIIGTNISKFKFLIIHL